jgi:hypothetical protein
MSGQSNKGAVDRRTALQTLGVGVGVALTGCLGGGGGDSLPDYEVDEQAPARLQLLKVDFPEEITFGETFSGEVSFANTGGDPITSNAEIGIRPIESDSIGQTIELNSSDLASGENRTHSTPELTATQAGEFLIQAGNGVESVNDAFDDSFNIGPIETRLGEQAETPEGIRLTVNDVTHEQAILNKQNTPGLGSDEVYAVRETVEGQIIAVPRITIANATGDVIRMNYQNSFADGDILNIPAGSSITDVNTVSFDQPLIQQSEIQPGETLDGIILSEVSTDDLGNISVGLNVGSSSGVPDVVVPLPDPEGLPKFELVDSTTPSARKEGPEEYTFEMENVGDADGTFRGAVRYQFTDESELGLLGEAGVWELWDRYFVQDIAAGESETVSFTSTSENSVKYELMPLGETFTTTA